MNNKVLTLIFIAVMGLVVYMAIDAGNTASAFTVERKHFIRRIDVLDSTIAFLRGESDEILDQIELADSLIAKLKYQGWQLRVELADGLAVVAQSNQTIKYNETDSALVELLRSAYSERVESGN